MRYYAIKGPTGKDTFGYATKPQLADIAIMPSHHEIYDATLFTNRQDAENALGDLPHKVAIKCNIVAVDVVPVTAPLPIDLRAL